MKKLLLLLFFLCCITSAWSQTDTLVIRPTHDGLCTYSLTVKNRNAAQQSIDEIKLEIVSADSSLWFDPFKMPPQWGFQLTPEGRTLSLTAQVNLIGAGQDLSGFVLDLIITASMFDKPVSVKWTTLNGSQQVSTGTLSLICTDFQFGQIDTVTVSSSISNNDPSFNFTVFNRNAKLYPISRFVVQLTNPAQGTMRPSRIIAPSGWQVDSVSALYAYFSTTTNPIDLGANLGGFRVNLRGNPAVSQFTFNWFSYEEGGGLLGRDTLRNISVPGSFTAAAEADSVSAAVVNGCLYTLTVKNYHVANGLLPSRIRKVVLWSKTPGLTFAAAPSAPPNWTKTVKADSIIYTASADSTALPSGKISNLFRFSVDPPSTNPFTIGWRTFRDLTNGLSTGDLQLQCNEQPPLQDTATIEEIDICNWDIRITNQHNTPASDLYGIELSIPAGSGKLNASVSSLFWTKTNETETSVRFVAPSGAQQGSNTEQAILFSIEPTSPGSPITLTWSTFEEAGLQSNTPLKTGTFSISCTPIVLLCDLPSAITEPGGADSCMQNFTIKSQRNAPLVGVTFEPRNGWTIDSVISPPGWDVQLDANRTLASFTNAQGIAPSGSQEGFRLRFKAVNQSDTFGVKITTIDTTQRQCDSTMTFICKSQIADVAEHRFTPDQISVVPNPVSYDATIDLTINEQGRVTIAVLDLLGHTVRSIPSSIMLPGTYKLPLVMNDLEAGTYYLRVQTPYGVVTKKLVLTN